MQEIFCDEPYKPKSNTKSKSTPDPTNLLQYLVNRHVLMYGETVRTHFSKENMALISTTITKHNNNNSNEYTKIPYVQFLPFIFKECVNMPVYTNVIIGKAWPSRFADYVDSLKVGDVLMGLVSPCALPCWAEYNTFMACLKSFIAQKKPVVELIKNFTYSNRISDLTLDYIYTSLEIEDDNLDKYFTASRLRRVLPFEDITNDLNLLLQNYDTTNRP